MTPAVFARSDRRAASRRARRASVVCFAIAATMALSADSCDREDTGAILNPTQTSPAGAYTLTSVIRTGTDSVNVPLTYTNSPATPLRTFTLTGATLTLTANAGSTTAGTFTMSVAGTDNGVASNLLLPTNGTWTQSSGTITFSGADFSTFTGTRTNNVLRISPVTIDGRGTSALRFTRQ